MNDYGESNFTEKREYILNKIRKWGGYFSNNILIKFTLIEMETEGILISSKEKIGFSIFETEEDIYRLNVNFKDFIINNKFKHTHEVPHIHFH